MFRRWINGGVWGAAVTVALPAGQSVYQLQLDAQDDRVDVVARTQSAENVVSLFATQVQPGLTLAGGSRMHIRLTGFRVLDAGRGVGRRHRERGRAEADYEPSAATPRPTSRPAPTRSPPPRWATSAPRSESVSANSPQRKPLTANGQRSTAAPKSSRGTTVK